MVSRRHPGLVSAARTVDAGAVIAGTKSFCKTVHRGDSVVLAKWIGTHRGYDAIDVETIGRTQA